MWLGKRFFDFSCSLLGLLILWPLFFLIAVWIKFDSAGPVFFRQQRVGLNGKSFWIHKFRTMRISNEGLQITVDGDNRITSSGVFLRKYKLDELAQLIDVLLGDMSLVGPRPEVPRYVACYPEEIRTRIFSVKPGITDYASIEFKDENAILANSTDPERDYVQKILPIKWNYHLAYVEKSSLMGDLEIILKTLRAILFR